MKLSLGCTVDFSRVSEHCFKWWRFFTTDDGPRGEWYHREVKIQVVLAGSWQLPDTDLSTEADRMFYWTRGRVSASQSWTPNYPGNKMLWLIGVWLSERPLYFNPYCWKSLNSEESTSHLRICFRSTLNRTQPADGELAQTLEMSIDMEEEHMRAQSWAILTPRHIPKGH